MITIITMMTKRKKVNCFQGDEGQSFEFSRAQKLQENRER